MLNKHKHEEHEKHHGRHHEEHEKHHGKKHEHHEKHHSRHEEHKKHHRMKEGGYVDKSYSEKCKNMSEYADQMVKRFAEGGVAKVRHGQSTADGNQLNTKKVRNTGVYY